MTTFDEARALIWEFKGEAYRHGLGILSEAGAVTAQQGSRAALVRGTFPGSDEYVEQIKAALGASGVTLLGEVKGARPNAPREDLFRITEDLKGLNPDVIVGFGGGSTLDAIKAADVLRTQGGSIEDYFGTDLVTKAVAKSNKPLTPSVSIQTISSSAAHLTKYSNITDLQTAQKKLIVDEAIVPGRALFDYEITFSAPATLTADGALDGIAHSLEVLYGAVGKPYYALMEKVAYETISLVVTYLPGVLNDPNNVEGREALGLATDLGGYAIMVGGTNGGHLTSFSLVDILSHGRACAMLNPYYTVFFAPAIKAPLRLVGGIFKGAGFTTANIDSLVGRDLGLAVAEAMINFADSIGVPTTLGNVSGFTDGHIERALNAAKNPQLKMKLENMPVPLTAEMIDDYMGPVLQAAKSGELDLIRNVN